MVTDVVREIPDQFPEILIKGSYDVAIQGFGAMGSAIAQELHQETGLSVVAVSEASVDSTVTNRDGISYRSLVEAHRTENEDGVPAIYGDLEEVLFRL